ncbi:MAG: hypothetical protein ACRDIV_01130 [Ktedonobacteraceae bacterium]
MTCFTLGTKSNHPTSCLRDGGTPGPGPNDPDPPPDEKPPPDPPPPNDKPSSGE